MAVSALPSFACAKTVAGPTSRFCSSNKGSMANTHPPSKVTAPSAMAETTMQRKLRRSYTRQKPGIPSPKDTPLFIQPPPRGLGAFLPVRGSPRAGTPRKSGTPKGSPRHGNPLGAWVVFRHEEEWEETESSLEIGLGQVKAQIPLGMPFRKPISIIRCPSVPKSPNSQMQLSFAFSFQFPVELKRSDAEKVLLPVALSLTFSIPLLPFISGVGSACGAVAESAFEFSVGEAQASIPFCVPIPNHNFIPELVKISKALPALVHA